MSKIEPFASLATLRAGHKTLLEQRRNDEENGNFQDNVRTYIRRGQKTGTILELEDERWEAQNLLDFWSNELYHLTQEDMAATLADYDASLEPELDDSLCPYIGLDPFDTTDHNLYFGREPLVNSMIERLKNGRFLALSGPSGGGKTSLVLAGLIPKLQEGAIEGSEEWLYLPAMVPGSNPVSSLIDLLRTSDNTSGWIKETKDDLLSSPEKLTRLINRRAAGQTAVLVVDQFEEIFTLCQDQDQRQAFMSNLLHLAQSEDNNHIIILTMRTDLESNLVRMADFQAAYANAQLRVTTMNASELRQAIRQPAKLVGLKFEDGLTEQLVSDVLGEPAALPLLQFTLLKLWENRTRNKVTWEAYKQLGGGRDALANTADKLFNGLNPAEQNIARKILLKMVRPTQGLDIVRNRVLRKQLYDISRAKPRIDYILSHFVRERLIRLKSGNKPENDQLEIAHEALVKNWPRLIGWLEEERVALRHRLRLTEMAEQWESLDRDQSALLRGLVLEEAQQYNDLSDLETAFVAESVAALKQEELQKEAARQRELIKTRQFARRLTFLVIALLFVFVIAVGFAFLARDNALKASENEQIAEANAATAVANEAAAQEARETAEASALIAEQSAATAEAAQVIAEVNANAAATAEAEADDERLIAEQRAEEAVSARAEAEANELLAQENARLALARELATAALSQLGSDPQLSLLLAIEAANVTLAADESIQAEATDALYRALQASQQVFTLAGHTDSINDAVVSPNGRYIATASDDNSVKIWDAETGQTIHTLDGHEASVTSLAFSENNTHLLSGDTASQIIVWDVEAGTLVRRLTGEDDRAVRSVAFHPDGEQIGVGYDAGTARIWDFVTSSSKLRQFRHNAPVTAIEFSNDGTTFVTAGEDGIIIVQNTETGIPLTSFEAELTDNGFPIPINAIAISNDGTQIAAAKADGDATLWLNGEFQATFPGHSDAVTDVDFNEEGDRLATASLDGSAKVWDVEAERAVLTLSGFGGGVTAVAFYPSGERIVTANLDGASRIWNTETGLEPLTLTDHRAGVNSIRYSKDGSLIATASNDKTARIWDALTGENLTSLIHSEGVNSAELHPTEPILATATQGQDPNVRLWDLTTDSIIEPFYDHPQLVNDLAFNPDGTLLATAAEDGIARLWELATNEVILRLEHADPVQTVSFNSDGSQLLTTSGTTAVIWDVASGEILAEISGHNGAIQHAIFSPDDSQLATASADGTVKLWNLESGSAERTFSGHSGPVNWVTFSEDGSLLATASVDKTARLWDVATGQVIRTIIGHTSAVTAVTFNPDGTELATSSFDSTARITPLTTTNDLLIQSWNRLARPLTETECNQYLHGDVCLTTDISGSPPTIAP